MLDVSSTLRPIGSQGKRIPDFDVSLIGPCRPQYRGAMQLILPPEQVELTRASFEQSPIDARLGNPDTYCLFSHSGAATSLRAWG